LLRPETALSSIHTRSVSSRCVLTQSGSC
jgi:hypothetical protein